MYVVIICQLNCYLFLVNKRNNGTYTINIVFCNIYGKLSKYTWKPFVWVGT